ncbi:efflux RND transporter periplasmic adaptor subunit [Mucilaginibacter sp. SG564]|uniref:efflux RND transporter periplasmic adaptor subunit n=1 Tax=unclassified Mucilaginibacter TaxID=2617802 RepID=UPI00155172E5|nr:efflux RND transporter periplasmic adaptor subunit [Mucilaginibacter sp. SG564]NOW97837.1 cobalt-zinc-cadmium efflux system membrane fusion protein [Mucilaginibacter sp. SG564]
MKRSTPINPLIFAAAVMLLLNLFACNPNENKEQVRVPYTVPDSLMKTLVIDTVKITNITYAIKFNGAVDFNTDKVVNLFPLISGTLQDINVMQGDQVKAGQVLGVIKSAEVANYNAALINAETNVRLTAKQLDQQRDLFKSGLASKVDITSAEVNYEQAIAARTAAQRILRINGNNPNGEYVIKSPIDGFIVQKNVTNSISIRTDNSAPMFTISNLKKIWVEANVYEENIGKVHEGDEAEVSTISYPDKVFKGKVDKLMNVLDPNSKVMKMKVVLDNPNFMLKPQMFATVTVNNTENEQAIAVSSSDLIFDHSQYYVIILKGPKDVQIRPVEVSSINGKLAYIKSGVSKGDRLIGSQAVLIYGSLNN